MVSDRRWAPTTSSIGSYGLDQCLDLVEQRAERNPRCRTSARTGLIGRGVAAGMIDTIPPRGHHAECRIRLAADGCYELSVGTAEFGNGTTTVHRQIAATLLGDDGRRACASASPTPISSRMTPAPIGSTGTVVAGSATRAAAAALADGDPRFRGRLLPAPIGRPAGFEDDHVVVRWTSASRSPKSAAAASDARASRSQRIGHCRRHAALGRLQRAGLRSRGASALRRNPDPAQHPRRRRGDSDQSDAMPRTGRGRRRAGDRRGALRRADRSTPKARSPIRPSAATTSRPSPTRP